MYSHQMQLLSNILRLKILQIQSRENQLHQSHLYLDCIGAIDLNVKLLLHAQLQFQEAHLVA